MNLTSIILLSVGLLFLLLFFLMLFLLKKKSVSLTNTFGYEIFSSLPLDKRLFFYFLLFVFSGLSSSGIILGLFVFKSIYLNIISITFILGYILICLSIICPLSLYKYHLACYYLGSGLISSSLLLFFIGKVNTQLIVDNSLISMPISTVFLLLSVTLLIFIINPNNSSFYKLNKVQIDGQITYEKPKINFLALEEWSTLIILGLVNLLFIIQLILLN